MKESAFQLTGGICIERGIREGYDHIWDAIPYYELMDFAEKHSQECALKGDMQILECAEKIVRENICACCSAEDNIIQSITEDFVGHLRKKYYEEVILGSNKNGEQENGK